TLLKAHDKTSAPPLPRTAFVLLGGWLGWVLAASYIHGPLWLPGRLAWLPAAIGAVILGIGGWIIGRPINQGLGALFRGFHLAFQGATQFYTFGVARLLRFSVLTLVVYGGLVGATYWGLIHTPRSFIPSQDMGYLFAAVQLPDSASNERTERVMR